MFEQSFKNIEAPSGKRQVAPPNSITPNRPPGCSSSSTSTEWSRRRPPSGARRPHLQLHSQATAGKAGPHRRALTAARAKPCVDRDNLQLVEHDSSLTCTASSSGPTGQTQWSSRSARFSARSRTRFKRLQPARDHRPHRRTAIPSQVAKHELSAPLQEKIKRMGNAGTTAASTHAAPVDTCNRQGIQPKVGDTTTTAPAGRRASCAKASITSRPSPT